MASITAYSLLELAASSTGNMIGSAMPLYIAALGIAAGCIALILFFFAFKQGAYTLKKLFNF